MKVLIDWPDFKSLADCNESGNGTIEVEWHCSKFSIVRLPQKSAGDSELFVQLYQRAYAYYGNLSWVGCSGALEATHHIRISVIGCYCKTLPVARP